MKERLYGAWLQEIIAKCLGDRVAPDDDAVRVAVQMVTDAIDDGAEVTESYLGDIIWADIQRRMKDYAKRRQPMQVKHSGKTWNKSAVVGRSVHNADGTRRHEQQHILQLTLPEVEEYTARELQQGQSRLVNAAVGKKVAEIMVKHPECTLAYEALEAEGVTFEEILGVAQ